MSARQHHKGRKRPRAWHLGHRQGLVNDRLLRTTIEPAFQAAERDQQLLAQRASENRRARKDQAAQLAQLERSAPFVPVWEIRL